MLGDFEVREGVRRDLVACVLRLVEVDAGLDFLVLVLDVFDRLVLAAFVGREVLDLAVERLLVVREDRARVDLDVAFGRLLVARDDFVRVVLEVAVDRPLDDLDDFALVVRRPVDRVDVLDVPAM